MTSPAEDGVHEIADNNEKSLLASVAGKNITGCNMTSLPKQNVACKKSNLQFAML